MRRSFYQYLMTLRNPHGKMKNERTQLADTIYADIGFPIHSTDYEEITNYLELEGYVQNMCVFDEVWQEYVERN